MQINSVYCIRDAVKQLKTIEMAELKTGDRVSLVGGKSVTIKKELGRGGQGIVYLVNFDGKDMALKWYLNAPDNYFY
ncbi:MAG: hypothetical protein II670_08230, partial [Alphaproteobacteria bacterium]|nr:hypothetical protein [Alphaproteobacteria bacterium]